MCVAKVRCVRVLCGLFVAATFGGLVGEVSGQPAPVDLGTLGGTYSQAVAVNDLGRVVGMSTTAGDAETHGFSWTPAGGMVDLGTLGGTYVEVTAVNNNGQVVGASQLAGDSFGHAFSWTQAGGMVDFGTLSILGYVSSGAIDVNASGQIVGWSYTGPSSIHAFSWTQAGGMVDLGTLGGSESFASAVNASGQVVGASQLAGDSYSHAFSWTQARARGRHVTVFVSLGESR